MSRIWEQSLQKFLSNKSEGSDVCRECKEQCLVTFLERSRGICATCAVEHWSPEKRSAITQITTASVANDRNTVNRILHTLKGVT
jgi:hypothetical protein